MAGRGASYNQIWCRYLYALRNPRWPPSAILDLLGETWAHPRSCIKNFVTIGWVVFKLQLIFCCSGLKVLFAPQKFQFFGEGLTPKFRVTSFRFPKGTPLHETTRFEPSLVQIWRAVRPMRKPKKQKKTKKRYCGKLAETPTWSNRNQILRVGFGRYFQISSFVKIG